MLRASDGYVKVSFNVAEVSHLDVSKARRNLHQITRYLELWMRAIADSPLNEKRRVLQPCRTFLRFRKKVLSTPLKELIVSYSALAHKIVSSTTLMNPGSITGTWVPEMKDTPIFKEYLTWYRTGDPQILAFILTFLWFGKKLEYDDDEMNPVALRGWEGVEQRLADLTLDDHLVFQLRHIIKALIPNSMLQEESFSYGLWPKFGPGAVSEKKVRGTIAKTNNLLFNPRLDRILFSGFFAKYEVGGGMGFHPERVLPDPYRWTSAIECSEEIATLLFVPKDIKTSRTICMEPNSFMFAQQAVQTLVRRVMKRAIIRRIVDINDQSRNRKLAEYGSATGGIDTIDLSSASDSVSLELVRKIFSGRLLYYLLGTRTSKVRLPNGDVREVKKFAPMGSALCFPVQSIIFSAVVVLAAMQHARGMAAGDEMSPCLPLFADVDRFVSFSFLTDPYSRSGERVFKPAAVFGDDICVDSRLTHHVTHILSSLGFTVNTAKSFTGAQAFRESCGGYYHLGCDVTPLYYRVKNSPEIMNPECVASMVACANRAGDRHYRHIQSGAIQQLLHGRCEDVSQFHGINPFMFTSNKKLGYGIFSVQPRNTHLESREHRDYQRDELRCIMVSVRDRKRAKGFEIPALDRYNYLRWWGSRIEDDIPEFSFGASRSDMSGSRLRRVWVPV